eukprot:TRINITY_DN36711_c0_g1_i1.p1 TRINITY_DN36711_c0_g1~~TRINITY_DN36711_c0_g1_i1.p1  ORF type:complete len:231 (+),score=32.02 TRINITY_DN36711_c0_g1_i1:74-694(+)
MESASAAACAQCGNDVPADTVLGMRTCGICGAVLQDEDLKPEYDGTWRLATETRTVERIEADARYCQAARSAIRAGNISSLVQTTNPPLEMTLARYRTLGPRSLEARKRRWDLKNVVERLGQTVMVQETVQKATLALAMRHVGRLGKMVSQSHTKAMVGACMHVAATRLELGLTMQEISVVGQLECRAYHFDAFARKSQGCASLVP